MVGVADLDGSLVTAEVVIDDGEVTAGGMIDTKDPLNDVPPQTSVPLSCTHTLTPSHPHYIQDNSRSFLWSNLQKDTTSEG